MSPSLKVEFPSQGWRQILTGRDDILDQYDRARVQAKAHEVETFHGRVLEGAVRGWLSAFLPKRFGVTSGYVVSPGLPSSAKLPHFDVIIYEQNESPILWIESNADASEAGKSRAIPAEHVRCVLEVKSRLSARNVREGIEHLRDLSPLMQSVDPPDDVFKLHLPATFACGLLFAELLIEDASSSTLLSSFIDGIDLRGFWGGAVLRGEGHTLPHTGRITPLQSATLIEPMPKAPMQLLEFGIAAGVKITDNLHLSATIIWMEMAFSQFAFDLVAMSRGTYVPGRLSSFYGFGQSFAEVVPPSTALSEPTPKAAT